MAPEQDPAVGALLARGAQHGVRFVRLTSPMVGVELVAALRRGEIVAFQLDRAMGGRGDESVPFFGAPATFPLGPFLIAAAAGRARGPGLLRARGRTGAIASTSSRRSPCRAGAEVDALAPRRGDPRALRRAALGPVVQLLRRLGAPGRERTCRLPASRRSPSPAPASSTAIGQDLDGFWAGLVTGVSGISEIEGFPVERPARHAGRRGQEAPAGRAGRRPAGRGQSRRVDLLPHLAVPRPRRPRGSGDGRAAGLAARRPSGSAWSSARRSAASTRRAARSPTPGALRGR